MCDVINPVPKDQTWCIENGVVVYRLTTEWEKKTLLANGFKVSEDAESTKIMYAKDDQKGLNAYIAQTVAKGGIGGT